ncbi:hypothetical protein [Roseofilum capinflatum]|uniref:Uncharacterized protein n=1 Tax=Roseofilum capinflatum BLCC-M114 TaxID=3022440 RepID=A0ABT7B4L8_9CYAN|nr:hypothetical protein [Roseofilum capinflatum]MDJ1174117.1 hypothetical protein [Roseofilum capinflatum BLCC-M114]
MMNKEVINETYKYRERNISHFLGWAKPDGGDRTDRTIFNFFSKPYLQRSVA